MTDPVITITFSRRDWLDMPNEERGGIRFSTEWLARSPWFRQVDVLTNHDGSQTIRAWPISDAEVWRLRCEEARDELEELRGSTDRAFREIGSIIRGEVVL